MSDRISAGRKYVSFTSSIIVTLTMAMSEVDDCMPDAVLSMVMLIAREDWAVAPGRVLPVLVVPTLTYTSVVLTSKL